MQNPEPLRHSAHFPFVVVVCGSLLPLLAVGFAVAPVAHVGRGVVVVVIVVGAGVGGPGGGVGPGGCWPGLGGGAGVAGGGPLSKQWNFEPPGQPRVVVTSSARVDTDTACGPYGLARLPWSIGLFRALAHVMTHEPWSLAVCASFQSEMNSLVFVAPGKVLVEMYTGHTRSNPPNEHPLLLPQTSRGINSNTTTMRCLWEAGASINCTRWQGGGAGGTLMVGRGVGGGVGRGVALLDPSGVGVGAASPGARDVARDDPKWSRLPPGQQIRSEKPIISKIRVKPFYS